MKTIRVYKDNVREHIFRTMFFTDTVLFLGGGVLLAAFTLVLYIWILRLNQAGLIISTMFLGEVAYALVASLKIDHQPLYKIIPRAVSFRFAKKQYTMHAIGKTTGDFKVIGNYILRKKKLIGVYEIRPFDIALLNDEERERYYHHIKIMLHTLPAKVQLISRKQTAQVEDYHDHFFSLYDTANKKINWLIGRYIQELSGFIEVNTFQMMKYYAVFSTPLLSNADTAFVASAQKLEDMAQRFSASLALERIHTMQVTNQELVTFFQDQFRNI